MIPGFGRTVRSWKFINGICVLDQQNLEKNGAKQKWWTNLSSKSGWIPLNLSDLVDVSSKCCLTSPECCWWMLARKLASRGSTTTVMNWRENTHIWASKHSTFGLYTWLKPSSWIKRHHLGASLGLNPDSKNMFILWEAFTWLWFKSQCLMGKLTISTGPFSRANC